MISINGVTVSFGGRNLLDNITFVVGDRDRIGLVGKNGAGKSTLLKVITGEQPASGGTVSRSGDVTIGYLAQQMPLHDGRTVMEEALTAFDELNALEIRIAELGEQIASRTDYQSASYERLIHELSDATERFHMMDGDSRQAQAEKALLGLGFRRSDFERSTSEFSGGWRMRIELAKILLRRPSVILLDEPTNHLDIESIGWLEDYLKDYRGAVVLISHDRRFLDTVTTRTVEIMLGRMHDYNVPYSKYVVLRAERRAQQMAAYENQQKLIKDTEDFIERFRYKPTKSNQVQSRIKQLEKLDIIEVDEEDTSSLSIRFPSAPRSGNIVLEVKDAGKCFGDKRIFAGAEFTLERGDKVAFVGRNGEGKTTLARMIVGDTPVSEGTVRLGHNVAIGYYAQNQEDLMDGDFTVFDTLDRVAVGDIRTRLRDILGAFLFRGEEIDKKVKVLSGGERSRLAMARLMLKPYNLLILDEPTNHMDMRSKDVLKKALMEYDGTLIVVSHDREFLEGLVSKVYEFTDGRVREHLGGIDDFLYRRKMESMSQIEAKPVPEKPSMAAERSAPVSEQPVAKPQVDFKRQKELERMRRKLRSAVEAAEAEIERLEAEKNEWDGKMADPGAYGIDVADPKVFEEYDALKSRYNKAMNVWEAACEELEAFDNKSSL